MGDASGDADTHDGETALFFQEGHGGEAEGGAGQAIENAEHIAKEKSDDKDPNGGYQGSFLEGVTFQDKKHGQIGKAQLDPGDSGKYRDQGFHISKNDGDGCKQAEVCCLLFHILYLSSFFILFDQSSIFLLCFRKNVFFIITRIK